MSPLRYMRMSLSICSAIAATSLAVGECSPVSLISVSVSGLRWIVIQELSSDSICFFAFFAFLLFALAFFPSSQ